LHFARARDLSSDSAHRVVVLLLVAVGTFFSSFAFQHLLCFLFCSQENLWSFPKTVLLPKSSNYLPTYLLSLCSRRQKAAALVVVVVFATSFVVLFSFCG
jgi:hypothetical protein